MLYLRSTKEAQCSICEIKRYHCPHMNKQGKYHFMAEELNFLITTNKFRSARSVHPRHWSDLAMKQIDWSTAYSSSLIATCITKKFSSLECCQM